MSQQFTLPNGCAGVTMSGDKTRYAADATGHITVDNPKHIEQIREKGARYFGARIHGFEVTEGDRCVCGFAPHKFSTNCPRCGAPLKE